MRVSQVIEREPSHRDKVRAGEYLSKLSGLSAIGEVMKAEVTSHIRDVRSRYFKDRDRIVASNERGGSGKGKKPL